MSGPSSRRSQVATPGPGGSRVRLKSWRNGDGKPFALVSPPPRVTGSDAAERGGDAFDDGLRAVEGRKGRRGERMGAGSSIARIDASVLESVPRTSRRRPAAAASPFLATVWMPSVAPISIARVERRKAVKAAEGGELGETVRRGLVELGDRPRSRRARDKLDSIPRPIPHEWVEPVRPARAADVRRASKQQGRQRPARRAPSTGPRRPTRAVRRTRAGSLRSPVDRPHVPYGRWAHVAAPRSESGEPVWKRSAVGGPAHNLEAQAVTCSGGVSIRRPGGRISTVAC